MKGNEPLNQEIASSIITMDRKFAEELALELTLSHDDLTEFVKDIREGIQYGLPIKKIGYGEETGYPFIKRSHQLLEHEIDVRKISIETSKGLIEFTPTDPYFNLFRAPIVKIRKSIKEELSAIRKIEQRMERRSILRVIFEYFYNQKSLNPTTILYATGLFMVHFELFGYKPILKREDFSDEEYEAWDYKHYIVDIVKRRLKDLIHQTYIDDPAFEKFKLTDDYKKWLQSLEDYGENEDLIS